MFIRVVFEVTESSTLRDEMFCKTSRCPAFIAEQNFLGHVGIQFVHSTFCVL